MPDPAWLYSVTRNRHRHFAPAKPTQDIDGLEFADNGDNAEVLQQKSEQARLLRAAMESLSNDQSLLQLTWSIIMKPARRRLPMNWA